MNAAQIAMAQRAAAWTAPKAKPVAPTLDATALAKLGAYKARIAEEWAAHERREARKASGAREVEMALVNIWRKAVEDSKAEIAARVECRKEIHPIMFVPKRNGARTIRQTKVVFSGG